MIRTLLTDRTDVCEALMKEFTHAAPGGCDDEHRRRRLLNHASETETSSTSKIINRSSDLINIFLAMAI